MSRSNSATRAPVGVTEMEYRRAVEQNRSRSAMATSIVDSAALQNEMSRKYNLGGVKKNSRPPRRIPAAVLGTTTCDCCGSANFSAETICSSCGYYFNSITTAPETFAQRRGLVPVAPVQVALTPFDWSLIENSRSDPDSCCPICMEGFRQGHEVLLSCSHIFHRSCLRSFENFIGSGELTCPICRTKNYQKKITHIGSIAFQKVCALKIQCLYRGYTVRKHFKSRLRQYYRDLSKASKIGGVDQSQEQRRKQYYEAEFSSITNKLNENLDSRSSQVNTMLRTMDRTLVESQQLDVLFEQMLANRRQTMEQGASTTATVTALAGYPVNSGSGAVGTDAYAYAKEPAINPNLEYADECMDYCVVAQQPWKDVYAAALGRCPCDCAICMLPVGQAPASGVATAGAHSAASNHNSRRDVVLSCAHIFHEKCIGNFERFLSDTKQRTCPVCRSAYMKKLFRVVSS